ncbi:MAG: 3-hydroxyacyl-CoA dehydrogenase/enoyl-CoA hydratase family protein, partial [Balneolaceae bacterium]
MRSKRDYYIRNVVILGAGVMGSQIAAHCVNAGLDVWLLDLKTNTGGSPNSIVEKSINRLQRMKPSAFGKKDDAARIKPGNFDDDMEVIRDADWVCEAVSERLDIKREMMSRVEQVRPGSAIVSSNTSGLPIGEISEKCGEEFQKHFLGTHFFNPPRYMKLLEMIPAEKTDPSVVEYMSRFCEVILGKGVIYCRDTPNFIANRIGVFSIASILPWFFNGSFRAEEIDLITGTVSGYSKAATFRTSDLAGLDILYQVAKNLYPAVPDDEQRELFMLPEKFINMVEKGWTGKKAGQGFYKRDRDSGKDTYLVINPFSMDYEPQTEVEFSSITHAGKKFSTPGERLKYLVNQEDEVGRFLWKIHCDLLCYSANRIPEITESVEAIDRAMRWGFNWELGPFERWDAIGVEETVKRMEKEGVRVPGQVKSMLQSGRKSFYKDGTVYNPAAGEVQPLSRPAEGAVTVMILTGQKREVRGDSHAGLYDMGDGIALLEFRTRRQTLGFDLVDRIGVLCEEVKKEFDALVIGHDHENFSYGADLSEIISEISRGNRDRVIRAVKNFQEVAVGLKYQPFPVVGAVSGRTFGGGAEIMMHCDRVVACYELYCGLVELGAGLVPAGGGVKELLLRSLRMSGDERVDPVPGLKKIFKTIGTGKVSDGAPDARDLGYLRETDMVVMHRDL